jgi:phospholipase/lecithinase/hemolysin
MSAKACPLISSERDSHHASLSTFFRRMLLFGDRLKGRRRGNSYLYPQRKHALHEAARAGKILGKCWTVTVTARV